MTETKKILIISHVLPCLPSAGNEIRIYKMLQWFKNYLQLEIIFLFNSDVSIEQKQDLEKTFGKVYSVNDNYPDACTDDNEVSIYDADNKVKQWFASVKLKKATKFLYDKYKPNIVLVEYIFSSPCLSLMPKDVLKIIDTHDVFSRRSEQVVKYGIKDDLPCTVEEEREYLLNADLILSIQKEETKILCEIVPELKVITVGIDYEISNLQKQTIADRILIVGSDNPLNIHGIKEFLENVWSVIREELPNSSLHIVGKIGNNITVNDSRVKILGFVKDLSQEYARAAIVVNPTYAGTGLKIKSVEALAHGKVLVTTPNGSEGLLLDNHHHCFITAKDSKEFIREIKAILSNEETRIAMEKNAIEYSRQFFNTEIIYSELRNELL